MGFTTPFTDCALSVLLSVLLPLSIRRFALSSIATPIAIWIHLNTQKRKIRRSFCFITHCLLVYPVWWPNDATRLPTLSLSLSLCPSSSPFIRISVYRVLQASGGTSASHCSRLLAVYLDISLSLSARSAITAPPRTAAFYHSAKLHLWKNIIRREERAFSL